MRHSARAVACVLVLATALAVSGCGVPDSVDSRCAKDSCTVHVHSGSSINLENLKLSVTEVGDSSVTFGSHGVSMKVDKNLDLRFGGHRFHLVSTRNGTADLQIK
jgi:hypothetical protein